MTLQVIIIHGIDDTMRDDGESIPSFQNKGVILEISASRQCNIQSGLAG